MHGDVISFYVEPDNLHIVMTVTVPDEDTRTTVRVTKAELITMGDAQPFYSEGPPQTPTPRS